MRGSQCSTPDSDSKKSLTELFFSHQGNTSDKWEQYLAIYEAELAPFAAGGQPVRLLEIGVQNGGSLQIWSKYLPAGSLVVGLDIDPACANLALGEGIRVLVADAGDPQALDRVLGGSLFDIILDDGSHQSPDIIHTFEACWDRLAPGGLFIVEDLHASYFASHGGGFRKAGAAMEWFKALADAIHSDHFEDDAGVPAVADQQRRLHAIGRELARLAVYDSVVVAQKTTAAKRAPYRRVMTGGTGPVVDSSEALLRLPAPHLRQLVLSPPAIEAFTPALLQSLADSRERNDKLEHSLADIIRERDEARERSAEAAESSKELIARLMRARAEAEAQAEVLRTQLAEAAAQLQGDRAVKDGLAHRDNEISRLQLELLAIRTSTSWRMTQPLRRAIERTSPRLRGTARGAAKAAWSIPNLSLSPRYKRMVRGGVKLGWWTVTLQLPRRLRERRLLIRAAATAIGTTPTAAVTAPTEFWKSVPSYDSLARARFAALQPLRTYEAPHDRRRVTIVTDSISAGSLYGGVGTAIVFGALLAERLGGDLRVVTRTEPPIAENIASILRTHDIPWSRNVETLQAAADPRGRAVSVCPGDVFLTTSWWTTRATLGAMSPGRIVYLLQEDERMFYPAGDEQLLCTETLTNPELLYVVNSSLLLRYLQPQGVAPGGISFEPAFPGRTYFMGFPENKDRRRNFFFYARPNNPRNLFWRGMQAVGAAIEQGIFDPAEWDFHFVGKDVPDLVLPGGVRPRIAQNMAWSEYAALVRKIDVGLSLMYTPHPSYPPLDLAASGAVVVTNRYGPKTRLDEYSRNILCVEPTIVDLVDALGKAAVLARDLETRSRNAADFAMPRDWHTAFAPILARIAERLANQGA